MWKNQNIINEKLISKFLIFDNSMPRSLVFCINEIIDNLKHVSLKNSRSLRNARALKRELFLIKILSDISSIMTLLNLSI